ncbi:MAG: cobalamin B12-binding domain-containing protein [Deltaproteobacteria bacterium]|nr:cobalamin B12-binding domain-containing protein [Deltaproteobacteria bacterium]
MAERRRWRVLIAKPGLDGHDRGAKVVARALRDAGMEVIYTGLRQSVDQIINAAIQEEVDLIGLSILSGGHMGLTKKLLDKLSERRLGDKKVVVGGVIPDEDTDELRKLGVADVFPVGTNISHVAQRVQQILEGNG